MKITASDLYHLRIIERIITEPVPASLDNLGEIAEELKKEMKSFLCRMDKKNPEEIAALRYERFRRM